MAYDVGNKLEAWLEQMSGSMLFGCASISNDDLTLDEAKYGYFFYEATEPYSHVFSVPLVEDERDIVLYTKGTNSEGEVTLLTTDVSRYGFTVQAPVDCRVDFIIGYKND